MWKSFNFGSTRFDGLETDEGILVNVTGKDLEIGDVKLWASDEVVYADVVGDRKLTIIKPDGRRLDIRTEVVERGDKLKLKKAQISLELMKQILEEIWGSTVKFILPSAVAMNEGGYDEKLRWWKL